MSDLHHVLLPGSSRPPLTGVEHVGPVNPADEIDFTVVLRRRADLPRDLVEGPDTVSRSEFAQRFGADPNDIDRVTTVFQAAGVRITDVHPGSRRLAAAGPASAVNALFRTELSVVLNQPLIGDGPFRHRARSGDLRVPAALDGIITAVLGLDSRQQARPRLRYNAHEDAKPTNTSYNPPILADVYNFPPDADGSGQTAAIIELGGGFGQSDLDTYFGGLNIPTPGVTAVGVDGAQNVAGADPTGADGEVLLDIEVLGALAPGARQLVYFAPNTDQGFLNAISTAVHATPTPAVVSISWGQSEDQWTAQARTSMDQAFADAAALGVTVCVASGDDGSADAQTDGFVHVDFPAASPHALACGGTSLRLTTTGIEQSESVWNDGAGAGACGGGVSDVFTVPSWQANVAVPPRVGSTTAGRGVPDVAADADPATGYNVYFDGKATVIGGTSAVAPLWAALVCRLTQALGRPLGLLQPVVYANAAAGMATTGFRDITIGNNGAYQAKSGWDPCTGLGVPIGTILLAVLDAATTDAATTSTDIEL
ncbi:MAG TPA: S53 family peptidase [Pseudonocardiaceae bacterium]|nr:S53 family peptidase [Pseudonocardiaceae bacterium]